MTALLVIDVGTTGLRAAVLDDQLQVLARRYHADPPSSPADGLVEDARLAFWLGSVVAGQQELPSWYAGDCTHPNSVGHDELHRLFYEQITGESL